MSAALHVGAWLRRDLDGLIGRLLPLAAPAPGLYPYRVELDGGHRRLHLRVDGDGQGTLFVDVTDAIDLNATAVEITKHALDGVPRARALAALDRRFGRATRGALRTDVDRVYDLVARLRSGAGCPTCAGGLERHALFATRARAPYKADVVLTYGCNNACAHCYNEADRLDMESLPADRWRAVLDRLAAIGVPHVIFTGGEATLHPDLVEMIAHADRLGLVTGLNSNGRRLAHGAYVAQLAEAGLDHVQITLASCRPEIHDEANGAPGAFGQTVRGIRNALAGGLLTITNTTLTRANAGHAEQILDFVLDLGIRTFAMNATIRSGGGFDDPLALDERELAPLLVRIRDHGAQRGLRFLWYTPTEYCRLDPVELDIGAKRCNAGEYSIAVEPSGDVLPCQSFYVAAGNILRDPWEQIWNGALFRSFREREQMLGAAGLAEECWECPDLPLCGGGCRIEREAREGHSTASPAACGPGGCGTRSAARPTESGGFVPLAALRRAPRAGLARRQAGEGESGCPT